MATSPLLALALVLLALPAILLLRTTLPIGPFYWDLFIYFDAASRIFDGQVPAVDFFTPAGPLGYWLFAGILRLFPEGQPLLIAQWSFILVTGPLFALVLADIDRRSRALAFALLVPFLVFSLLPFNVEEYYPYPGVDGFGIYNRQCCQLLYVLTAGLVFVEGRRTLVATIAVTMLALFLTKITGFIAGGMLCAIALLAGRIRLGVVTGAVVAFVAVLSIMELVSGVVGAYFADILLLLEMNRSSLLPRFLQAASIHVVAVAPLAALLGVLLVASAPAMAADARSFLRAPTRDGLATVFDRDVVWLGVASFAGLFFETQNTGGQAFIFVWPVLLQILNRSNRLKGARLVVIVTLVAASAIPTIMEVAQRAARALVGQVQYTALDHAHLKTLGSISQRSEVMERADRMIETYRSYPEAFQFLADRNQLPTFTLYSEPDFQVTWLKAIDEAVGAIEAYEAANGVRFETIMSLNFVNPFPWLLDRHAPLHIAIGADPFRAVPNPSDEVLGAVRNTDLVLYPKCPVTNANQKLLQLYRPGLTGHRRIELSPCWDAFVRTTLVPGS